MNLFTNDYWEGDQTLRLFLSDGKCIVLSYKSINNWEKIYSASKVLGNYFTCVTVVESINLIFLVSIEVQKAYVKNSKAFR